MKKKKAVQVLAALAQESRLEIFLLLMKEKRVSGGGLCAGVIAEILNIPPTTMSFHLSQLKVAGLVKAHKEGRSIIYRANKKKSKQLADYITCRGEGKVGDIENSPDYRGSK